MNNLVNNASAISLASERLWVFTRCEAYQCKIPPTKKISNSAVRKFPQMPSLISPCEHKFEYQSNLIWTLSLFYIFQNLGKYCEVKTVRGNFFSKASQKFRCYEALKLTSVCMSCSL